MRKHRHQKQHTPTNLYIKASYPAHQTLAAATAPRRFPAAGRHSVCRRWLATVTTAETRIPPSLPPSRQRRSITHLRRDLVKRDVGVGTRSADRSGRLHNAHNAGDAVCVQGDNGAAAPSLPERMQQSWAPQCSVEWLGTRLSPRLAVSVCLAPAHAGRASRGNIFSLRPPGHGRSSRSSRRYKRFPTAYSNTGRCGTGLGIRSRAVAFDVHGPNG